MKSPKVGAIDVGSNAIRLAIGQLDSFNHVRVLKRVRVPVRLGADVFSNGEISSLSISRSVQAFKEFKRLFDGEQISVVRAVATSAVRESRNREEFIREIEKKAGITVEPVSPRAEASFVLTALSAVYPKPHAREVIVDIGGGSVEFTLRERGALVWSESLKIGTVRLLGVENPEETVDRNIQALAKRRRLLAALTLGVGGNVERIGRLKADLLGRERINAVSRRELTQIFARVSALSLNERIRVLGLKPDRADVILPALQILMVTLELSKSTQLLIPYVGVKDGILIDLIRSSINQPQLAVRL